MIDWLPVLLHEGAVGLPFGLLLGVVLAPARLSGVDFRQWFRDPGQPSELSDDSWIGLTRGAALFMFAAAAGALIIAAAWLALPHAPSLASCCSLRDAWQASVGLLPQTLGFLSGVLVSQWLAARSWKIGRALVPDPVRHVRFLVPSATPVPPKARQRVGRRLIVCCDGTWNWPDRHRETNVVRLVRAVASEATSADGRSIPQITHYHLGVGTGNFIDRIFGGGIGIGLSNSVKSCYGFLVDNYAKGDEIFLFGFSRGAYVARSVAGLVGRVGILQKSEMERFIDVWDWYTTDRDRRRPEDLDALAPKRYRNVDIEGIGVWDTVGALGIPGTRFCAKAFSFHETQLGEGVRHAFQALAIDEQRGNFQAAVWAPNPTPRSGQVLEQVWFPGVHSNIGGGYEQHGLSDTSLLWMLSRLRTWNLLKLDMHCVGSALDQAEPYPSGLLARSFSRTWALIGCKVPRPVGITTDTERIHASAWNRSADNDQSLYNDIYHDARRTTWLAAMRGLNVDRCAFEKDHAVKVRGPRAPAAMLHSQKLGWCDRAMQWLAGKG